MKHRLLTDKEFDKAFELQHGMTYREYEDYEDKDDDKTSEPNFFTVIPTNIVTDSELIPQARLLYGLLSSLCKQKGYCWASNQYLAKQFNTHRRTVGKWLNVLEKKNYIKIVIKHEYKRKIYLTIAEKGGIEEKGVPLSTIILTPLRIKGLHNNIRCNNINDKNTVKNAKGILTGCVKVSPFVEKYTKKLVKALQIKRKVMRKVDITKWYVDMQKLKIEVGKTRFKEVLTWYCSHLLDKYTPKAYSAKTFREKFYNIEDAMNRQNSGISKEKEVEISPDADKLAKELKNFYVWPLNSASQLPQVIQLSINNYKTFLCKHNKFLKNDVPEKQQSFGNMLKEVLVHPNLFVRIWMLKVNKSVKNWKNWNGDLMFYVFTPKHKLFQQQMGYNWAKEYTCDATRWDKYMKVFNENEK